MLMHLKMNMKTYNIDVMKKNFDCILLALFVVSFALFSCSSNDDNLIGMEEALPVKDCMTFGYGGGRDTLYLSNDGGEMELWGVYVFDAASVKWDPLCDIRFWVDKPEEIKNEGNVYGTVTYDSDSNIVKIVVDQYKISRITDDKGVYQNKYAVSVLPSESPRRYRLSLELCNNKDGRISAPSYVDIR